MPDKDDKIDPKDTDLKDTKLEDKDTEARILRRVRAELENGFKGFEERLAAHRGGGDKEKDKLPKGEEDALKGAANAEAAELRARLDTLERERKAERMERVEHDARATVKAALEGKVRPEVMGLAMKALAADGFVKVSSASKVSYHVGGERFDDLDDALAAWLETPDAAHLRPAPAGRTVAGRRESKPLARPANGDGAGDTRSPAQRALDTMAQNGIKLYS